MKTKDLSDIRKQSQKKLGKLLKNKREELDKAKMDLAAGQEQNVKKVKQIKKDIAQIMTIIREKEIVANEMKKDKEKSKKDKKKGEDK